MAELGNKNRAIGGYFGIKLPEYSFPYEAAMGFQSARAALRFWLQNGEIKILHLPRLICDSIISAAEDADVEINFYNLRKDFLPNIDKYRNEKDIGYLLVNYFGLHTRKLKNLESVNGRANLMFDNSQALFTQPFINAATIYSPRKYFGLPDGGLLECGDRQVIRGYAQLEQDKASITRVNHLLKRASEGARAGYDDFLRAETTLEDTTPRRMSNLTSKLLRSVDFPEVAAVRQSNFDYLNSAFGAMNTLEWHRESGDIPLCYPLMLKQSVSEVRKKLAGSNIFCPTYWPEVLERVRPDSWDAKLVNNTLHLPCDQRYSLEDLKSMTDIVFGVLKNER
ncbi:hypothetical protein [Methylophaga thiooxydans]|uniref:hypothetical protein n=1 Tax=Methylophaga thiooxydans TaxID=392484 RepID=UPI002353CD75|nr:hypothetical protein [Methylophaga thiooxydans]